MTPQQPPVTTPTPTATRVEGWGGRRSLRPRTELRSYAESPDVVVVTDDEPRVNGFTNGSLESDSDDGEMPPLPPIKASCYMTAYLTINTLSACNPVLVN